MLLPSGSIGVHRGPRLAKFDDGTVISVVTEKTRPRVPFLGPLGRSGVLLDNPVHHEI
jgi:hypothetical protein